MTDRSVRRPDRGLADGFFVVVGSVGVGLAARSVAESPGFVIGLLLGTCLGFLGYSYLRYGR